MNINVSLDKHNISDLIQVALAQKVGASKDQVTVGSVWIMPYRPSQDSFEWSECAISASCTITTKEDER